MSEVSAASLEAGRYLERIYRLALLAEGDGGRAARVVEAAYRALPAGASDSETQLATGLPVGRGGPWRLRLAGEALARALLSPAQARAVERVLAAASPAARLELGRQLLLGRPPRAAAAPEAAGRRHTSARAIRVALARELGLVAPDGPPARLERLADFVAGALGEEAALVVRAELLERAEARAEREGLRETEEILRRALPALALAQPPARLAARVEAILHPAAPAGPRPGGGLTRRRLGLLGATALVLAAILFVPELLARLGPTPTAGRQGGDVTPRALLEASLTRFDAPRPLGAALHERYRLRLDGDDLTVERWLDLAPPHRLRVEVRRAEDGLVLFGVASDGAGLVQYRTSDSWGGWRTSGVDVRLGAERAAAIAPILRQMPEATPALFGFGAGYGIDRYYLAQARNGGASLLGATTYAGRAAQIVAYRSGRPLPPDPSEPVESQRAEQTPGQVLLTIDDATGALLAATVLPGGEAGGEALTVWEAETIEVLDAPLSREQVALEPAEEMEERESLVGVRLFSLPNANVLAPREALEGLERALYLPPARPDLPVGALIRQESAGDVVLFREGPHTTLGMFTLPGDQQPTPEDLVGSGAGEPRPAGAYTYRVLNRLDDMPIDGAFTMVAVSLGAPERIDALIFIAHSYADEAEREAILREVVASLRPLAPETLAELGRGLLDPGAAGLGAGRAAGGER